MQIRPGIQTSFSVKIFFVLLVFIWKDIHERLVSSHFQTPLVSSKRTPLGDSLSRCDETLPRVFDIISVNRLFWNWSSSFLSAYPPKSEGCHKNPDSCQLSLMRKLHHAKDGGKERLPSLLFFFSRETTGDESDRKLELAGSLSTIKTYHTTTQVLFIIMFNLYFNHFLSIHSGA